MNVFYIALSTIKRNFRDKKSLFRSILMPILMIIVLGTALNKFFQAEDLQKFSVAYLNEDKGEMHTNFENYLEMDDIKKIIEIKSVTSFEEGQKLVTDKKAACFIVIPKDYSEKIKSGEKSIISIYNSKYKDFKNSIALNIVDSYNSGGNTIYAISKGNINAPQYERYSIMNEESISIKGKRPGSLDYYAVAILILAIMNSAIFACSCIGEDHFEAVGARVKCTPIKSYEVFLGKLIGSIFVTFIKAIIVIAFSMLVYGANFGNNWGMIIFIVLTAAVMASALGMMICMVVGNTAKASTLINILINIFTFLAGGYAAIIGAPESVSKVMHLSPSFYAQTAMFNTIYPDGFKATVQFYSTQGYIMSMWCFSLVMFGIFYIVERRRA
jgi:ABC-2 type transport system permease protein